MRASVDTSKVVKFIERMKQQKQARDDKILQALADGGQLVVERAQTKYLFSGPLHRRSGRLINSVTASRPYQQGKTYRTEVGTNVFYGRIHEYGLKTPITPKTKGGYLTFRVGPPFGAHGKALGAWVRTKKVILKPKPWLGPSMDSAMPKIEILLRKAGVQII